MGRWGMHVMLCGEGGGRGVQHWKEAITLHDRVPSMKKADDVFILHGRRASEHALVLPSRTCASWYVVAHAVCARKSRRARAGHVQ